MEYIIYDKAEERFLDQHEASINKDGMIIFNGTTLTETSRFTVHQLLPKTDINDKKIYADCSIVEFIYRNETVRAIIRWDCIQLMYDVELIKSGCRMSYKDIYQEMFGLKVIGTLQKDKHLLEENND